MTVLERSIVINASTEQIDVIALDGTRFPDWYAGVQEATQDETYPEAGGVVSVVYKTSGVKFNMSMTCLRIVYGESLLLKMDGMITGKSRWIYTPEGDSTRLTCRFEYEIPGGGLGKALDKLVIERMNATNLEKSLSDLKRVVETEVVGVAG